MESGVKKKNRRKTSKQSKQERGHRGPPSCFLPLLTFTYREEGQIEGGSGDFVRVRPLPKGDLANRGKESTYFV